MGGIAGMRILVDMTQERLPYCGNGLVLARATLGERPDLVRGLVRTVVEATARYKQDKAAGLAAVGQFLRQRPGQGGAYLDGPFWAVSGEAVSRGQRTAVRARRGGGDGCPRLASLTPERISDHSGCGRWRRAATSTACIRAVRQPR